MRPALLPLVLAALATGGASGAPRDPSPAAAGLTDALLQLYARPSDPWDRWRHGPRRVTLPDGRVVAREDAYRDHPAFVASAAALLARGAGEDAALGAWLLGTLPAGRAREAEGALAAALRQGDESVRFEAALALAGAATPSARDALDAAAPDPRPAVAGAARWAAAEVRRRAPGSPRTAPSDEPPRLAKGFCRGVNWWQSERRDDDGRRSFARLAALGVDWVSIHTWDPLQRAVDSPEWAAPGRPLEIARLEELVRSAHASGLKVMVKPHLEMRGHPKSPAVWHNHIEMKSEADWAAWFARYEDYVLGYARQAQAAGADAFCVGRETDKAAAAREGDWRRLISRVRAIFRGPLTYSANFDGYARIPFWDALDVIGISAYFPLAPSDDPSAAELLAGWRAVLDPLEAYAKARHRRVVFTEIGYPALATAARRPWDETPARTDVWLQARLYEAALTAVAGREVMAGTFFWLWEGVSPPPFRDPSFSIQGKPASFVMARWYARGP
jgi:hypothetical protein